MEMNSLTIFSLNINKGNTLSENTIKELFAFY